MQNFEIRWLIQHNHKILQYRIKYDPTVRAGGPGILNTGMMTGFNPELIWSEWKDVPEVNDA